MRKLAILLLPVTAAEQAPWPVEMARVGRSRRSETPKSDLSANVFT